MRAVAVIAAVTVASLAHAQVKASASAVEERDAVLALVSFDRSSGTVVLQGAGGFELRFNVPADVQVFEHIRPGELFSMRYTVSRTHELSQSGVAGVSEAQAREFDTGDGRVVARLTNTIRVSLRVQAVDLDHRAVALRDTNDAVRTVTADEDDQGFDLIAAGDIVTLIKIESIALEILLPSEPDRVGRAAPLPN